MRENEVLRVSYTPASGERGLAAESLLLSAVRSRPGEQTLERLHRVGFHLLIVPMSRGRYVLEFDEVTVDVGDAIIRGSGSVQRFPLDAPFEAILFLLPQADHALVYPGDKGGLYRVNASVRRLLESLHEQMVEIRQTLDPSDRNDLLRRLAETAFAAARTGTTDVSDGSPLLRRFDALLAEHVVNERHLGWYATHLGCSTRTLARACQKARGHAAKRHLNLFLLDEAKRILVAQQTTIEDAADQLGFSEATNFVKWFRRETGQTPGTFRQESSP